MITSVIQMLNNNDNLLYGVVGSITQMILNDVLGFYTSVLISTSQINSSVGYPKSVSTVQ